MSSQVRLDFEGRSIQAIDGEPLAVSLFRAGVRVLGRSIKFHRPRSFFCLAGDCAACFMRVDGEPNVRACRAPARQGLRCERQNAWPSASLDVLAAADLFFAEGMDHHTLLTAPRPLNQVMQGVVRRLGGLGKLPDAAPPAVPAPVTQAVTAELIVVGAGPAGLAAAAAYLRRRPGADVRVLDAAPAAGGSYLSHPAHGPAAAAAAQARAEEAGAQVVCDAQVIGWYPEDAFPETATGDALAAPTMGLLAAVTRAGLWKLRARRYLYATGGCDQNLLFVNNDRPGVISARACGLLLVAHGIVPGRRPVVVGQGAYAEALTAALRAAGADALHLDGERQRPLRAVGNSWVRALEYADEFGNTRHVPCDLVAVAATPAPASGLPQQHGVAVDFSRPGGFGAVVTPEGRSEVPGVYACGDVTGYLGVAEAALHGDLVGSALAAVAL